MKLMLRKLCGILGKIDSVGTEGYGEIDMMTRISTDLVVQRNS